MTTSTTQVIWMVLIAPLIAWSPSAIADETSPVFRPAGAPTTTSDRMEGARPHDGDPIDRWFKIAQTIALFVGAGWVVTNYVLNRTHKTRLEPRLHVERTAYPYIRLTATFRNVGAGKVDVVRRGTAAFVWSLDARTDRATWRHRDTAEIVERAFAIEPGETYEEQSLLYAPLPSQYALRVHLHVRCKYRILWIGPIRTKLISTSFVLNPI